jgi:hypothetical protein
MATSTTSRPAGRRVSVNGRPGVVVREVAGQIGVVFDGETEVTWCDPTWRVTR